MCIGGNITCESPIVIPHATVHKLLSRQRIFLVKFGDRLYQVNFVRCGLQIISIFQCR